MSRDHRGRDRRGRDPRILLEDDFLRLKYGLVQLGFRSSSDVPTHVLAKLKQELRLDNQCLTLSQPRRREVRWVGLYSARLSMFASPRGTEVMVARMQLEDAEDE